MPRPGHEEGRLSKRKKGPQEERRRQHVELNLLVAKDDQTPPKRVRRGCTLPFLGVGLLLLAFQVVHATFV